MRIPTTIAVSAPDTAAPPPLLDPRMLHELRALDAPAQSFLSDLLEHFLASSETELAEIAESIETVDPQRVWRVAHGLKGACFMVGARRLGEAVACLERAAGASDLASAATRLPEVRREHAATRNALRALL